MSQMSHEVVLPRRVIPQPKPGVVEGGDCGGCCIAGLLNIPIERAYELQDPDERPKDAKDKPKEKSIEDAWAEDAATSVRSSSPLKVSSRAPMSEDDEYKAAFEAA